jgi:hypothetical protein
MTQSGSAPATEATGLARLFPAKGFMVSPLYDGVLFIGAPLVALLVVQLIDASWSTSRHKLGMTDDATWAIFIASWTYAHLFAVVFRSHGNQTVFSQFRFRFVSVPLVLFCALLASDWVLVAGLVTGALWDVYHTSMQNFGFCRIYDSKAGNPPLLGRRLDMLVNHTLYIGPILAGLSLKKTLDVFGEFSRVGWSVPKETAMRLVDWQASIAAVVLIAGTAFVAYYIGVYSKWAKTGVYRVSTQKIAVLVTTGATSILAWGFMPPFKAFFVANFFHALQYFAIVWALEKKTIGGLFRLEGRRHGRLATLAVFLLVIFGVGVARKLFGTRTGLRTALCAGTVCSLMHFWYDGFVWSVRKKQVGSS